MQYHFSHKSIHFFPCVQCIQTNNYSAIRVLFIFPSCCLAALRASVCWVGLSRVSNHSLEMKTFMKESILLFYCMHLVCVCMFHYEGFFVAWFEFFDWHNVVVWFVAFSNLILYFIFADDLWLLLFVWFFWFCVCFVFLLLLIHPAFVLFLIDFFFQLLFSHSLFLSLAFKINLLPLFCVFNSIFTAVSSAAGAAAISIFLLLLLVVVVVGFFCYLLFSFSNN